MEITDLRKHQEWQSPTLTSLAGLLSSNAFTQLREHQLQMNRTVAPGLDNIRKHQELIKKIISPSFAQIANNYAMTMTAKPTMEAIAAWQQPLAEVSATIAAQQKAFAQIARATKLTAMQEMLQHIHNCTPAVQVTIPKIDAALSAIKYIEENQPELCKQVDETLDVSQRFEQDYKATLERHDNQVDEATYKMAYDLGADVKHALEDLVRIICQ